ncbi:MAG TPA: RelA/SpoT family protein [Candidatus Pelagibacter bacterium]|jgi:GTP pyrophosphokinase/guanosine-3',5'-bis(diphosphate) 3'-pyrophosphohydrolase|nr:GTP pyrophosphokinase [Pelagibacteraceae bacterium]HJN84588.1 RelA/SpoT family protein [Candidatus Pelagibacter bacterium]|tara:strand:- start:26301 stop:28049 length:1749 start_codon:yes stop_codon:yes gene_type:complete
MLNSEELINKVKSYNKFLNPETLTKAYEFALKAHKTQKRDEGVPYIIHPIAVADILSDLKLDSATIATGLLHDTIEDTHATYDTIKEEFGQEVADLVDGVTKISQFQKKASENSKAENFRKLILATSKDIRVLLVKIADRLHNMRTINFVKNKDKQIRKAKETMEIYAPLADRMGMNRIRDELEDLSFKVLNNDARELIKKRLDEIKEDRTNSFKSISFEFIELLNQNKINAQIFGREKTPFSIWRKVQKKRVSLEQITDIIGFRIILDRVEDCYKALGIFHSKYNCIPGKFKDYISSPKINNYQSLHSAIIGPNNRPIEIQIRTMPMHEFAERGVASHWKYKSSEKFNSLTWKEYDWLKDLVEIIEKNKNPEHYFEYTKLQMFQENVFCFTPKGSIIKLPKDATPIDFAYAVHTKVGDSAISCLINGRENQLQCNLKNGDIVEIITSKKVSPSLHWLPVTKTGKARAAIRRYWQARGNSNTPKTKEYNSALWISLPDKPGKLGEVTTLVGSNNLNISSVEMTERGAEYINFKFNLIIRDLKNFTNLISELKQRDFKFKIIRHENKKRNAFTQKIFKYFKKN